MFVVSWCQQFRCSILAALRDLLLMFPSVYVRSSLSYDSVLESLQPEDFSSDQQLTGAFAYQIADRCFQ